MRPVSLLRIATVPALLGALGLAFAFRPGGAEFSERENRRLAPPPDCHWDTWFDGSCARAVDLYVADHFPGRERMFDLAEWLREHRGWQSEGPRVVEARAMDEGWLERLEDWAPVETGTAPRAEGAPLPTEPSTATDTSTSTSPDASTAPTATPPAPPTANGDEARTINGIVVLGDEALQLFGGTDASARAYAQVINTYVDRLQGRVRVHSVVVPTAVSFRLPESMRHRTRSEEANIRTIAAALRPSVLSADAYGRMAAHAAEPLFLRTDHHWNGTGAYYAYEAFCQRAGISPVPLASWRHGTKPGFVGSLASFTRDAGLRKAPDTVDYYEPPVAYQARRHPAGDTSGNGHPARFVETGSPGYLVFLGGDHPLMVAETAVKNGRRALVVKNSYGNAFAPFLLPHFEQVAVVDYRYYSGGLYALMQRLGTTDLVFVNAALLANAAPHRDRIAALGQGAPSWDRGGPSKDDKSSATTKPESTPRPPEVAAPVRAVEAEAPGPTPTPVVAPPAPEAAPATVEKPVRAVPVERHDPPPVDDAPRAVTKPAKAEAPAAPAPAPSAETESPGD